MTRYRIAAILLLTIACGNIGSPEITSTQVYEFRDNETGTPLVFHWPRSALPVRIWVASDQPFRSYVQTAIDRWQGAFLYGEFRATIVSDSNVADVIVRNTVPDIGGGINARTPSYESFAPQCNGLTEPNIDGETKLAQLPMHVFVYAVIAGNSSAIATCYSITATHELGHVLGVISPTHSGTTSADVMFGNPVLDGLSERDRLTAVILYSVTPTINITGRR